MRKITLGLVVGIGLLVFSAGCMTTLPNTSSLATKPVVPAANEEVVLDQLTILVDGSDSMTWNRKFAYEKMLVDGFVNAMPDGSYEAGINSFSGTDTAQWVKCPLKPYDRDAFKHCASRIVLLGNTTPLSRAIRMLTPDVSGKSGTGALLVYSDGRVWSQKRVLEACKQMKAAHQGTFCIYTVQIGDSARGKKVLEGMVRTAGCGQSWNGSELNSVGAVDQMIKTIFFGSKAVEQKAAAPAPVSDVQVKREMVALSDVLFDFDKDILKPEGKEAVDKLVAALKDNPQDTVVIQGHTCDMGTDEYNMDLSLRRANAVHDYALSQGIDAARMATKAYGETTPAVPNTDEANRKLNRRSVFSITIVQ